MGWGIAMDVFVARQPIFNSRQQLYGYELLYRKNSEHNFYEGTDENRTTVEVIANSFLVIGFDELIDNTRGFINFTEELLLQDMPALLPAEKVVLEILETVNMSEQIVEACRRLKARGYVLALDDFEFHLGNPYIQTLVEMADIIKVELPFDMTPEIGRFFNKHKNRIQFLAERVETEEDFKNARAAGFRLFQGYYFSKPIMMNGREIDTLKSNTLLILQEIQKPEPDFRSIEEIFTHDTGLSYKLLKLANSAYFSAGRPVRNIRQALAQIGLEELSGWVYVLFLRSLQTTENAEMIKRSVVRGKLASLLCGVHEPALASDGLFAGLFSVVDTLLGDDMEAVLANLPITQNVRDTLLGRETPLTPYIRVVRALEDACFDELAPLLGTIGMDADTCMPLYMQALVWQQKLPM